MRVCICVKEKIYTHLKSKSGVKFWNRKRCVMICSTFSLNKTIHLKKQVCIKIYSTGGVHSLFVAVGCGVCNWAVLTGGGGGKKLSPKTRSSAWRYIWSASKTNSGESEALFIRGFSIKSQKQLQKAISFVNTLIKTAWCIVWGCTWICKQLIYQPNKSAK